LKNVVTDDSHDSPLKKPGVDYHMCLIFDNNLDYVQDEIMKLIQIMEKTDEVLCINFP